MFADEYLIDLHATNAAIRAGYSARSARSQASQMLSDPDIQSYISERQQKISNKLGMTLEKVLMNFAEIYNRSMQAEPVLNHEGQPTGEFKFDATNANRANENMGKHLGFYKEDNEQSKPVTVIPAIKVYNSAPPIAESEKEIDV